MPKKLKKNCHSLKVYEFLGLNMWVFTEKKPFQSAIIIAERFEFSVSMLCAGKTIIL